MAQCQINVIINQIKMWEALISSNGQWKTCLAITSSDTWIRVNNKVNEPITMNMDYILHFLYKLE